MFVLALAAALAIPPEGVVVGDLWVQRTETTQAEWKAVMGELPYGPLYRFYAEVDDAHPVAMVSFDEALAYANARSEREGLEVCYRTGARATLVSGCTGYRLPTRDEWEALAGPGLFATLDDPAEACTFANLDSRGDDASHWRRAVPCEDGFERAAPVASFAPDPNGLYDLYGNVAEWVWDDEVRGHYATQGPSWYQGLRFAAGDTYLRRGPDGSRDIGLRLVRSR